MNLSSFAERAREQVAERANSTRVMVITKRLFSQRGSGPRWLPVPFHLPIGLVRRRRNPHAHPDDAPRSYPMTQTTNRFFDEAAKLMNDAAGVAGGVRREFDTMMRTQAE